MKNRVMTLAAAAVVVLGMSVPAYAQTTQMPTYELSAGYQLFRAGELCADDDEDDDCFPGQTFPFGLAVDVVRNFGALGIVGELGWARQSEIDLGDDVTLDRSSNVFHYAGGVRWTGRTNPRIWPYGQFLIGGLTTRVEDSDTDNRFMLQPGVGVNFVAGDGWGIFGQVDYRRVFIDEDEFGVSGRNDVRVFLGVRMILD